MDAPPDSPLSQKGNAGGVPVVEPSEPPKEATSQHDVASQATDSSSDSSATESSNSGSSVSADNKENVIDPMLDNNCPNIKKDNTTQQEDKVGYLPTTSAGKANIFKPTGSPHSVFPLDTGTCTIMSTVAPQAPLFPFVADEVASCHGNELEVRREGIGYTTLQLLMVRNKVSKLRDGFIEASPDLYLKHPKLSHLKLTNRDAIDPTKYLQGVGSGLGAIVNPFVFDDGRHQTISGLNLMLSVGYLGGGVRSQFPSHAALGGGVTPTRYSPPQLDSLGSPLHGSPAHSISGLMIPQQRRMPMVGVSQLQGGGVGSPHHQLPGVHSHESPHHQQKQPHSHDDLVSLVNYYTKMGITGFNPTGTYPTGTYPTGTYPTGTYPTGTFPSGPQTGAPANSGRVSQPQLGGVSAVPPYAFGGSHFDLTSGGQTMPRVVSSDDWSVGLGGHKGLRMLGGKRTPFTEIGLSPSHRTDLYRQVLPIPPGFEASLLGQLRMGGKQQEAAGVRKCELSGKVIGSPRVGEGDDGQAFGGSGTGSGRSSPTAAEVEAVASKALEGAKSRGLGGESNKGGMSPPLAGMSKRQLDPAAPEFHPEGEASKGFKVGGTREEGDERVTVESLMTIEDYQCRVKLVEFVRDQPMKCVKLGDMLRLFRQQRDPSFDPNQLGFNDMESLVRSLSPSLLMSQQDDNSEESETDTKKEMSKELKKVLSLPIEKTAPQTMIQYNCPLPSASHTEKKFPSVKRYFQDLLINLVHKATVGSDTSPLGSRSPKTSPHLNAGLSLTRLPQEWHRMYGSLYNLTLFQQHCGCPHLQTFLHEMNELEVVTTPSDIKVKLGEGVVVPTVKTPPQHNVSSAHQTQQPGFTLTTPMLPRVGVIDDTPRSTPGSLPPTSPHRMGSTRPPPPPPRGPPPPGVSPTNATLGLASLRSLGSVNGSALLFPGSPSKRSPPPPPPPSQDPPPPPTVPPPTGSLKHRGSMLPISPVGSPVSQEFTRLSKLGDLGSGGVSPTFIGNHLGKVPVSPARNGGGGAMNVISLKELSHLLYSLISAGCEQQAVRWEKGEDIVELEDEDEQEELAKSEAKKKGKGGKCAKKSKGEVTSQIGEEEGSEEGDGDGDDEGDSDGDGELTEDRLERRRRKKKEKKEKRRRKKVKLRELEKKRGDEEDGRGEHHSDQPVHPSDVLTPTSVGDGEISDSSGPQTGDSRNAVMGDIPSPGCEVDSPDDMASEVDVNGGGGGGVTKSKKTEGVSWPSKLTAEELAHRRQEYRNQAVGVLVSSIKTDWVKRYGESGHQPLNFHMTCHNIKKLKLLLNDVPNLIITGDGGFMRVTTVDHAKRYCNPYPPEGIGSDGKTCRPSKITPTADLNTQCTNPSLDLASLSPAQLSYHTNNNNPPQSIHRLITSTNPPQSPHRLTNAMFAQPSHHAVTGGPYQPPSNHRQLFNQLASSNLRSPTSLSHQGGHLPNLTHPSTTPASSRIAPPPGFEHIGGLPQLSDGVHSRQQGRSPLHAMLSTTQDRGSLLLSEQMGFEAIHLRPTDSLPLAAGVGHSSHCWRVLQNMVYALVLSVCQQQFEGTSPACPLNMIEQLTQTDIESPRYIQTQGSSDNHVRLGYARYQADLERYASDLAKNGVMGLRMGEIQYHWQRLYPQYPTLRTMMEQVGVMGYHQLMDTIKGIGVVGNAADPLNLRCIIRRTEARSEVGDLDKNVTPMRRGTSVVPVPGQMPLNTGLGLFDGTPVALRNSPLSPMGVPSPPPPSLASTPSPTEKLTPQDVQGASFSGGGMRVPEAVMEALQKMNEATSGVKAALCEMWGSSPSPGMASSLSHTQLPHLMTQQLLNDATTTLDNQRNLFSLEEMVNRVSGHEGVDNATTPVSSPVRDDLLGSAITQNVQNDADELAAKLPLTFQHLFPPSTGKANHDSIVQPPTPSGSPVDRLPQQFGVKGEVVDGAVELFGPSKGNVGTQTFTQADFMRLEGDIKIDGFFNTTDGGQFVSPGLGGVSDEVNK